MYFDYLKGDEKYKEVSVNSYNEKEFYEVIINYLDEYLDNESAT